MPMSDDDVLQALRGVNDPEIGFNIVDLGLVYRAEHGPDGIEVALSLTTPSCPLGEMLVDEAREVLHRRFPDAPSVHVELVWDPPWSPDRMSEAARRQLG
jgi:metal-sulfur cluster biosynthetic enzyme